MTAQRDGKGGAGGAAGDVSASNSNRRRQIVALGLSFIAGGVGLQGCGSSGGENEDAALTPAPTPAVGRHGLAYLRIGEGETSLSVDIGTTQSTGSTILVCVGRGDANQHTPPVDNMGNVPFLEQDAANSPHLYALWSDPIAGTGAGTALYAFQSAAGGMGHRFTVQNTHDPDDEVTLAVVEIKNGGIIQDVKWNEDLTTPNTSLQVNTTGPATLVAFWWGDHGSAFDKTAVPNNDFTVIDSILEEGQLVQCAVATKDVPAAGTYDVTWAATPPQGAQLWLVAVQRSA